jgi:hypothetical protein
VAASFIGLVDDVESVGKPEIKKFCREEQNCDEEVVKQRERTLEL